LDFAALAALCRAWCLWFTYLHSDTIDYAQIIAPMFMYFSQLYIGTRSLWFGHMYVCAYSADTSLKRHHANSLASLKCILRRIHKQVYAGMSGALVATLLLAAVSEFQSNIDKSATAQLNDTVHKSMMHLAINGTLPAVTGNSASLGDILNPITLAIPIVSGLAMQLCVRDVSVLGTLGALVLAILAAMAGTVDGSVSHLLLYWSYSTFFIVGFFSLPSAVASGLLPQSFVCTAALGTWQRPDAAVIKRNIELGENREATGTMFDNTDGANHVDGPGAPGRMPLNVHTSGPSIAITGTAPLNESDSEEEVEGEEAAAAARYGGTWYIPREDGGSIVVYHSGETCVSSQPRAPAAAAPSTESAGRSLYPRWRVFMQPPARRDGAVAPQLPREHPASSPRSWSLARLLPWSSGPTPASQEGSRVEAAPLLDSGDVDESTSRAGAGSGRGPQHAASGSGEQGVTGLGLDASDVDLFDMAGGDSDDSAHGHFVGAGEEQGSRGGTGTAPHTRAAQRPKSHDK